MRPIRLGRLARWGAAAMLLLLVHGLVAPRSAWAGCNHLVRSRADRLLDRNQLDSLIIGGVAGTQPDGLSGPPGPRRPRPCSGPGCSNRVPMPVPTAAPIPGETDQWGTLSGPIPLPPASPLDRVVDGPAPGSRRRECAVFHPPRI